jgi:hypothetical protein
MKPHPADRPRSQYTAPPVKVQLRRRLLELIIEREIARRGQAVREKP